MEMLEMASRNAPLFWCVWCEDGGPPTVKHPDFDTARSEAKRLARANPTRRFIVLAAALAYEIDNLVETTFDGPGAPDIFDAQVPF
jgi:hypothetical protein